MGPFESATGTVVSFDERSGYGTLWDVDGTEWVFHCTSIADQTRLIDIGAEIRFEVRPGRMGRWEATNLQPDR